MSQTVTAVQTPVAIGRIDGHANYASYDFPVTNTDTVHVGDFVKFDGAGAVNAQSITGSQLVGIAEQTTTGNSGLTNTVKVCVDPNMLYLISCSSALTSADVGQFFDLQGAAGAQVINTGSASSTSGAFVCLAAGPDPRIGGYEAGVNTSSYGIFKLVEHALYPYVA